MGNGIVNGASKLNLKMDLSKWIQVGVAVAVAFMGLEMRNLKNEVRLEVREYIDEKFPGGDASPAIREMGVQVDENTVAVATLTAEVRSLDTAVRRILDDS